MLLVDKPAGWTSHDVVARCRRLAGTRRVGHAGTLDPMATGLLLIGIGRATKLLTFLVGWDKGYTATIRLGQSTVTDDAEGDVVDAPGATGMDQRLLLRAIRDLSGEVDQVPSSVSAIKVNGVRSYARVRGGEQVELKPRSVVVSRFEVLNQRSTTAGDLPVVDLDVEVEVSSGTYIRALARDLGAALGTGGHLTALRRTRIGRFEVVDGNELGDLSRMHEEGEPLPVAALADAARAAFPVRELEQEEEQDLRHGKRIVTPVQGPQPIAGLGRGGDLVAILDASESTTRSLVVFPPQVG
ncbi:MAG: tRNA pseudouridine(55) synthase TruB [Allobranchiibius sp.]